MAVMELKNPSSLRLKYDTGNQDENGNAIRKTKSYGNVNPEALAQACYDCATSISGLQDYALIEVQKVDSTTIAE